MNKIDKILGSPEVHTIEGVEVSIYPLDFEDTMGLMSVERIENGNFDLSKDKSKSIVEKVMIKKLKQSLTEEGDNGQKVIPSDDDIKKKVSMKFYIEYMNKLFGMMEVQEKK